jgi:hypothetical protein
VRCDILTRRVCVCSAGGAGRCSVPSHGASQPGTHPCTLQVPAGPSAAGAGGVHRDHADGEEMQLMTSRSATLHHQSILTLRC